MIAWCEKIALVAVARGTSGLRLGMTKVKKTTTSSLITSTQELLSHVFRPSDEGDRAPAETTR